MTYDLTTIGEGQIRLTCERGDRLATARSLRMTAAGSEANVAGLLAELGRSTAWTTKLPRGELADRIALEYSAVGVDMSRIVMADEGRVALYFLEPGEFPLPGKVTYDRQYTPFRSIVPEEFDWDALLDTRVVFLTGITAALTPETARVVRYCADAACERGVDVALDVNFRSLLWDGDQARTVLEPIARRAAILFCSRSDAGIVFGIDGEGVTVCRALREEMGAPTVVSTDGRAGDLPVHREEGSCLRDQVGSGHRPSRRRRLLRVRHPARVARRRRRAWHRDGHQGGSARTDPPRRPHARAARRAPVPRQLGHRPVTTSTPIDSQ